MRQGKLLFFPDVEIASLLGLEVQTLRAWRVQGRGPVFHKFGRAVRYDLQEVERWLEAQSVLAADAGRPLTSGVHRSSDGTLTEKGGDR